MEQLAGWFSDVEQVSEKERKSRHLPAVSQILRNGLFDRWYTPLVRYALRSTANYDRAEDLVQDVFLQLYKRLRSGKCIEHPKAWTLCVLRRAVNRQLQERFQYEELNERELAQSWPEEAVVLSAIQDHLCLLSRREEEALLLRLEAMKYPEIADHLAEHAEDAALLAYLGMTTPCSADSTELLFNSLDLLAEQSGWEEERTMTAALFDNR